MLWPLLCAAALLSFANGANDNFKGVATLYGSGTAGYRASLAWATVTTFAGSLCAVLLAAGLVGAFSGKGLVDPALAGQPRFMLAVGTGAALAVLLATRLGLPVSTTHALVGALVGAGLVASSAGVAFSRLGGAYLLPLLASPLLAGLLVLAAGPLVRHGTRLFGGESTCVCLTQRALAPAGVATFAFQPPRLVVGTTRECAREVEQGLAVRAFDAVHYLSAGAVGFARGLNDTPKIAALAAAGSALAPSAGLIGAAMAAGGLFAARRVARTIGEELTAMDAQQGLAGNLVTAGLVLTASLHGLPVSTTHVSTGALFGIGVSGGRLRWSLAGQILLAWLATLPLAGLLAALAWVVARQH